MKTNRFNRMIISSAPGSTPAFSFAWSGEQIVSTDLPAVPSHVTVTLAASAGDPAPGAGIPVAGAASVFEIAAVAWLDIKDCTFFRRAEFFAGLNRLDARVEWRIDELTDRRATIAGTAGAKDWDFAMEVMKNAQFYLTSMGAESREATAELWEAKKPRVGQAWVRTQNAYANVKFSATS